MKGSNKYYAISIAIIVFVLVVSLWSRKNPFDQWACKLKDTGIKGRVSKIVQTHELIFYVDSIKQPFPFHFHLDKPGYRELNAVGKGEIYMLPKVGDSIFKEPGSKFVKFKRRDKIFIEEIILNDCD
jgi:hypothetical protein